MLMEPGTVKVSLLAYRIRQRFAELCITLALLETGIKGKL
jgi:hypothetical protein